MGSPIHQDASGASGGPWCLVGPMGLHSCAPEASRVLYHQKKISKKFHGIWTSFDIDILQMKEQEKTQQVALGTMSIG